MHAMRLPAWFMNRMRVLEVLPFAKEIRNCLLNRQDTNYSTIAETA
jgi:hypothetical protein